MKTENPQQTTKVQLSHSKLYLWKTCPRQYLFRYSDKIKQIVWPGNLVGQTFHRALETSINLKTSGMDEQLILLNISGKFKEWYNEEVEKNKHDYQISQEVKRGGEKFYLLNDKLMTSFVKFILKYFYNLGDKEIILESEKEYSIDWDWDSEIQLNGFVDVLLIGKDYYKIFDLKVTKDPTSYFYVNWASATQKIIYEYFICPKSEEEELRSGTWATYRAAKKLNKKIIIIYPSGRTETWPNKSFIKKIKKNLNKRNKINENGKPTTNNHLNFCILFLLINFIFFIYFFYSSNI